MICTRTPLADLAHHYSMLQLSTVKCFSSPCRPCSISGHCRSARVHLSPSCKGARGWGRSRNPQVCSCLPAHTCLDSSASLCNMQHLLVTVSRCLYPACPSESWPVGPAIRPHTLGNAFETTQVCSTPTMLCMAGPLLSGRPGA